MDPDLHLGHVPLAAAYAAFAQVEARGSSASYEEWAAGIANDESVLALLATLPPGRRQPNLVLAAARLHGADGPYAAFRRTLLDEWERVRATVLHRTTQTNEAGRCATLLPVLAGLPQPLALLEVGASAGLCLLPDRWSYRYDDGTHLDPADGPSPVVLPCTLGPGVEAPAAMPQVVWRAGLDLAPVDVTDADACAWLRTLVWPEHDDRRVRLEAALDVARLDPPPVVRGDLLHDLPALAATAPPEATLVVTHSAVLAYVEPGARRAFVSTVTALPGHWLSNEGRRVLDLPGSGDDDSRFVVALDGRPVALADPHGRALDPLPR